jgi:Asp/Glu/hydantoin racemase
MNPRLALISATPAAIGPAVAALAEDFPQAQPWNILDDRLLADAHDGLTAALADRMRSLIGYAVTSGADGVLLTCSLYGVVAKETAASIPVLAPDEAAFEEASDYGRILVVASLKSALQDSIARFTAVTMNTEVSGALAPQAFGANGYALRDALIEACEKRAADAVLLAQYSLAPAATALSKAIGLPVISGPRSAAARLKAVIEA